MNDKIDIISASTVIAAETTASPVDDWEFIRLQDEKPGDIPEEYEAELTRGEVVDIFASIFGRGTCGSADDPDSYSGPAEGETPRESATNYLKEKYKGRAGAQQLAAEFGLGDLCLPDTIIDGGEIDKPVYLHASSDRIFDDYTIVSYDAKLSRYSLREHDIYARVEFSNTSYAPIYYYVDTEKLGKYLRNPAVYGDVYEWRGSVRDQAGNIVDNPSWVIKNGRVHFPGTWSGILVFKRLPIKYHYYILTIRGTVDGEATRHYDARVSAKAAGLSAVHLDLSEEVKAEDTKEKCPWLDIEIGTNGAGTEIVVECKNCDGDGDQAQEPEPEPQPTCDSTITAEEYNEECCGGPLVGCLPPCRSITTTVQGPIGGEEPDEYCGKTTVITLMPKDGKPCGRLTKTWVSDGGDCCASSTPIRYDPRRSPDVIAEGWQGTVYWQGGLAPYTVSLEGTGFYLDADGTITEAETDSQSITIYARGSCGTCDIEISDNCQNSDTGQIRSTNCEWVVVYDCYADPQSTSCGYWCYYGVKKYFENRCGGPDCDPCEFEYCGQLATICGGDGQAVEGRVEYECQCPS